MTGRFFTFHTFRLDTDNECLWRGDRAIPLRPKSFAVLLYLVARPNRLVTKDELLDAVWADTAVTDGVLKGCVREIREALGDDPAAPRYLETAHRRGYRFVAPVTAEAPARSAPPAGLPGRAAELAELARLMDETLACTRRVAFVTGEPGIGKTALVEAFLAGAAHRCGARVARGQCIEQYGAVEPYLPVLDALASLCRGPAGAPLLEALARSAPTWLSQMPSLVEPARREALERLAPGTSRERMLREVAEAIETFAAETPLVLLLEDLHWSDFSTLDLVSYLARRRAPARLMLVATYRPAEVLARAHPLRAVVRELRAHGMCHEMELPLLDEGEIGELLERRLPGDAPPPPALVRFVHRRTEGNPLFAINLIDYLVASATRESRSPFDVDLERAGLLVPEGVRQMIEAQVDALDDAERALLSAAAVAGAEPSTASVAAALGDSRDRVEEVCERLARRAQFLESAGVVELPDGSLSSRYRFVHALYQDVLCERVPPARRSEIHRRVGEHLSATFGSRDAGLAAELAMHFEEGRDYDRALRYLLLAIENAERRFASREAIALARRGLALLGRVPAGPDRDRHELALLTALGLSLRTTEGFAADEVLETFGRARELCARLGDDVRLAAVLAGLWGCALMRADLDAAHDLASRLLALARSSGDGPAIAYAHWTMEVTCVNRAEFARAVEHYREIVRPLDEIPHGADSAAFGQDPQVICRCFGAWALWSTGLADTAEVALGEARELARAIADPQSAAFAEFFMAFVAQLGGDPEATRRHAEATVALSREHGFAQWLAFGRILGGWAAARTGAVEEGIAAIREGLEAFRATGARLSVPHFRALLAESLSAAGRHEEGIAELDLALDEAGRTGERYYEAEIHRLRAGLLLAAGATAAAREQAARSLERALEVAAAQGALVFELRAAAGLVRLGRGRGAPRRLSSILSRFTEWAEGPDLVEARALLAG